jgi:hypothetical protein
VERSTGNVLYTTEGKDTEGNETEKNGTEHIKVDMQESLIQFKVSPPMVVIYL